jgi:hypothetical protein
MDTEAIPSKRFHFHEMNGAPARPTFAQDVALGLAAP